MTFKQGVTRINGLSDRRRLPRLGVIRLGIKAQSEKSGKEYPVETDYFVVPDEVAEIYGGKPKELDVMLPLNEIEAVFPQAYKYYGSSKGLKCQGDGNVSYRINSETKTMEEGECPCDLLEEGKCKQSGTLMVILPKVSVGGIYQIRTSSFNSIVDVNSGLDYVQALLGRFALVPLTLRRVKTETHHDEKKQNHYTLQIIFDGDINTLNALRSDNNRILEGPRYQLPAPVEQNPELEPVDIIVDEEAEIINGDVVKEELKPNPLPTKVTQQVTPQDKPVSGVKIVTNDFKFLNEVKRLKMIAKTKDSNLEGYYNCLGVHGFEHSNEITDRKDQEAFYSDLKKYCMETP